jgi:hypothetical protein
MKMLFKRKDKRKNFVSSPVKSENHPFSTKTENLTTVKKNDSSKENLLKNSVDTSFVYYDE